MKPGRMRAKALGVVSRGRSLEGEPGAWKLKGNEVSRNRRQGRDVCCICAAI